MKTLKHAWVGVALLAFAGSATAQDPVGNFYLALDNLVISLDSVLDNLVVGDATGVAVTLNDGLGDFLVTLSQDTLAEDLAVTGADLGDQLIDLGAPVTSILDQLLAPGAQILAPLAQIYLDAGALENGLPFVNGRSVVFFDSGAAGALEALGLPVSILGDLLASEGQLSDLLGALLSGGDLLGGDGGIPIIGGLLGGEGGIPIIGGLLGGEGGIPIIGGLLGGEGGIPIIGGLLGGEGGIPIIGGLPLIGDLLGGDLLGGGIPIIGGLLGGEGGIPIIGGLLGGDGGLLLIGDLLGGGGIPIIGGLLGGGSVVGAGNGLAVGEIPLPLAALDPATAIALVNGVTLAGL